MMSLARMAHWSGGTWALLVGFLVLLVVGIVLGVQALGRPSDRRAREILAERLAGGEITAEEHRERSSALGRPRGGWLPATAVAITAAGLVGVLAVAAIGPGSGVGLMHDMMPGGMGSMMGGGQTGRSGSPPAEGAEEARVVAREFSFDPGEIRVRAGATANVVFDNRGHMFHTLTAGGLGFELRANGGDRIAGAFRPERPGTYPFLCAVSGHAEAGMRGRWRAADPHRGSNHLVLSVSDAR